MRSKSQILSKLRADGHITDEEYKMLEQDPKTGNWIEYTRVLIPEPINSWEQAWYCSECGYGNQECEDGSAWLEWKYCPNCGACVKDCRTLDEFIEDSKESEEV